MGIRGVLSRTVTLLFLTIPLLAGARPANCVAAWTMGIGLNDEYIDSYEPLLVAASADGGCHVAGLSSWEENIFVAKISHDARIVWLKLLDSPGELQVECLRQTSDGGCILAGSTTHFGMGGSDGLLVRFDAAGNMMWQRTYGLGEYDNLYSVRQAPDGGFIAAGTLDIDGIHVGSTWVYEAAWVLRLDAWGNVSWQKMLYDGTYSYSSWDKAVDVEVHGDGFLVAGLLDDSAPYICRIDSGGNPVWSTTIQGGSYPQVRSIAAAPDGGVLAVGSLDYSNGFVAALDADGMPRWHKTVRNCDLRSITMDVGGAFVAVGTAHGNDDDGLLTKWTQAGELQQILDYGDDLYSYNSGDNDLERFSSASACPTGGLYSLGSRWSSNEQLVLMRMGADGIGCGIKVGSFPTTIYDTGITIRRNQMAALSVAGVPTIPGIVMPTTRHTTDFLCGSAGSPTITSISSRSHKPGSKATIVGSGFSSNKNHVTAFFGGKKASVRRASPSRIGVKIPNGIGRGTVQVWVKIDGKDSNRIDFEIW